MSDHVCLIHGDCFHALKDIEPNSIDALITDPPAGIAFMGKGWDTEGAGRDSWIGWMFGVMKRCHRAMKPGAHGLVWAIPRTSHWTMTALEDAGFEIRDVVTHLFGTGFPKSLDISKAIDKAAGAEREIVGVKPGHEGFANRTTTGHTKQLWERPCMADPNYAESRHAMTAPATAAAKQWQGYGTALKPACEFWVLVRKPCSEKTVAANVLKWGTGGLNIDGCRIAPSVDYGRSAANAKGTVNAHDGFDGKAFKIAERDGEYASPLGRFPANLVLSHNEDCELTGSKSSLVEKKTKLASNANQKKTMGKFKAWDGEYKTTVETETVEEWKCSDGCAVKMLDEQSGTLAPQGGRKLKDCPSDMFAGGSKDSTFYGDRGGASRFFYCAKASKSDRGEDNKHPTAKSTKLMEYLIRLITPEGGTILDPFMGSGTTGVAAKKLGMKFIGIEQEKVSFDTASKRMKSGVKFTRKKS